MTAISASLKCEAMWMPNLSSAAADSMRGGVAMMMLHPLAWSFSFEASQSSLKRRTLPLLRSRHFHRPHSDHPPLGSTASPRN